MRSWSNGSESLYYFSLYKRRGKGLTGFSLLAEWEVFNSNEKPFLQNFSLPTRNEILKLDVWRFFSYWLFSRVRKCSCSTRWKTILLKFVSVSDSLKNIVFHITFSSWVNTGCAPRIWVEIPFFGLVGSGAGCCPADGPSPALIYPCWGHGVTGARNSSSCSLWGMCRGKFVVDGNFRLRIRGQYYLQMLPKLHGCCSSAWIAAFSTRCW